MMSVLEKQKMLKDLIEFYGVILEKDLPPNISGVQLLGAIAENESTFGLNRFSKHEVSWDQGGKYFDKELWMLHGSDASCSRSSFQIMFPIAVREYGLSKELKPQLLDEDHVAIFYVIKYIKKKVMFGAATLEQILDAYNSGTHKDAPSEHVKQYIERGVKNYYSVRANRGLKGGRITT